MSGILIVAEHTRGVLADVSTELIGAALHVKESLGGPLRVAIVGNEPEAFIAPLNLAGVDEIITVNIDSPHFDGAACEEALHTVILRNEPAAVLIGHCANGISYAAALAVRLGCGFAADIFKISVAEAGLRVTRSGYGSKVDIEVDFPGQPLVILTVRGATFKAPADIGSATVVAQPVDLTAVAGRYEHQGFIEAPSSGIDIGKAEFIMSVGRGIQDEKNIPRFEVLAEKLGATLGCSRPVADSGWLHKSHQVGLTGKVAANCKLYLALGISGAVQHLHGMKHVETIIAVNTDPNAPIYNVATYGAVVDVFEFADALEKAVQVV